MTYKWPYLVEQRRRLVELVENAAREHYEMDLVENDGWSTPDDIIRAKDAERRGRRAYVKKRQELCRDIDAAALENGVEPNRRIRSRILDALLS